jgi:hypothetical protein
VVVQMRWWWGGALRSQTQGGRATRAKTHETGVEGDCYRYICILYTFYHYDICSLILYQFSSAITPTSPRYLNNKYRIATRLVSIPLFHHLPFFYHLSNSVQMSIKNSTSLSQSVAEFQNSFLKQK